MTFDINKMSLRIVNIIKKYEVLIYYNAERFLQYFGSIFRVIVM